MALIVQKFGGTSVGDTDRIHNVANRIKTYYTQGHDLVVVLSAMGKSTDHLVSLAAALTNRPSKREMDMLLSTGEQVSIALMAMALESLGVPAISFTGAQVGIRTNNRHTEARIESIDAERIRASLAEKKVCLIAGFQGVDENFNITTLGRGGSDTSAVAMAVALGASECEIYTDVDGVYTTDPNKVPEARKVDRISYEEMLELARLGAGVLHSRSVEMASKYGVTIHVRSSFNNAKGTLVVSEDQVMEKVLVRGVTLKSDEARISVIDIPDRPGLAADLFGQMAKADINVDMIVQSTGRDEHNTISFTVPQKDLLQARSMVQEWIAGLGKGDIEIEEKVAIVSAVGVGMKSHSGVAARMFQALAETGANIEMISTSEIKLSVVVHPDQGRKALEALHKAFELGDKSAAAGT
jgi:aspartate kinase